jgi:basic membrane lipoprotein Med (substrate-binding protein (PBP1-ABC) superfamily)
MLNTHHRISLKVMLSDCRRVILSAHRIYRFILHPSSFILSCFLLASCATPTPTPPPPATTIAVFTPAPTLAPSETAPPPASTPTSTLAAPTTPIRLAYVGLSTASHLQSIAQGFGWAFEETTGASAEDIRAAAQSGAQIIVVGGQDLQEAARDIAREFSQIYFIGFGLSEGDIPPNMLSLGGPESRQDQAGFLAGMVAGFATEKQYVTAVSDPHSAEGRKYRNGFLHGVRYACPKCRVEFIDVANTADSATASAEAAQYVLFGSDVFFAAAGEAGDAALIAAAQKGAWVIGSGYRDAYATIFGNGSVLGSDKVLTSVYVDVGAAVYAALADYKNGTPRFGIQPFSAANGAIVIAPFRNPTALLSIPDQADIATALARLADGSLETGIDPMTGEEK